MSKAKAGSRRSRSEWALLVEAWAQSGLGRIAFAERQGVHPGTFSFWVSRLAPKKQETTSAAQSSFVPVRVRTRNAADERAVDGAECAATRKAACAVADAPSADSIEIALANGRRVRCTLAQVSDPRLAALLALAEGARAC